MEKYISIEVAFLFFLIFIIMKIILMQISGVRGH